MTWVGWSAWTIAWVSGLATAMACLPVFALLRRAGVIDYPNRRSLHSRPVVRGGGLAIVIAVGTVAVVVNGGDPPAELISCIAAALGMATLGLADDVGAGLSPLVRLVGQFVVAGALLLLASVTLSGVDTVLWVCLPLALIFMVNAYNFMDGVNGVTALSAAVTGIGFLIAGNEADLTWLVALAALMVGSALAFLPANFPRPAMFLGDVGSYFLGGLVGTGATLALWEGAHAPLVLAPLLIHVIDVSSTLLRRIARKDPWLQAHRIHTYQLLVAHGWSHAATSGTVVGMSAALTAAAWLCRPGGAFAPAWWVALAFVTCSGYAAVGVALDRRELAPVGGERRA